MLEAVRVPQQMVPPFEAAEKFVRKLFGEMDWRPSEGVLRIGGERYVILRCASLYAAWFDALADAFGRDAARDFIYNTAREIGRSDSASFSERRGVTDGLHRLSCGPVHFAHAGWALVDILPDSAPAMNDEYFLHYRHPNTFESEVLAALGKTTSDCACLFSAGYSAGWCSSAFQVEVHGREIRCVARGDGDCEFIMAPAHQLDRRQARLTA